MSFVYYPFGWRYPGQQATRNLQREIEERREIFGSLLTILNQVVSAMRTRGEKPLLIG
jgi:hypothetical protein